MKKKPLIITAIAAAVITGGYFFVRDSGAQTTYLTEEVKRGNIEKNVVATGSIESINTVDVGAQVSGKVTKLYVKLRLSEWRRNLVLYYFHTDMVANDVISVL